jgi:hypothetical protein
VAEEVAGFGGGDAVSHCPEGLPQCVHRPDRRGLDTQEGPLPHVSGQTIPPAVDMRRSPRPALQSMTVFVGSMAQIVLYQVDNE